MTSQLINSTRWVWKHYTNRVFKSFRSFWCADVNKKKLHFNIFLNEKHFKLPQLPQFQIGHKEWDKALLSFSQN
jgi:hypothetical protein